jgi:MFS family permease
MPYTFAPGGRYVEKPVIPDNGIVAPLSAQDEWKRGGSLVMAAFVGFSFLSIMTGSLSMFIEPVGNEFGWSRTLTSAGFTIAAIFTALLSPFFGIMVDRYGSRRIALPGILATIGCISAFSLANGSTTQWIALWVVYAIVSITVKTTVWTAAVAGMFTTAQGLALGITLCGTAAAQAILPPLANWLIDDFGWRMAYVWLGVGWGTITFIICWFFLFDAHDRRKKALAATQSHTKAVGTKGAKADRPDFPGLTMPEAWRSAALWRIAISTLLMMALTVGLSIHQIPILTEAGVTRTQSALLASLAGIAGIAGKLITGVLLDRYNANWIGGLTLAATALAFGLLIDGLNSPAFIVFAMIVNGYTQGTKLQINGYLTARFAGMKNFGKIYGVMNAVVAFGSAMGPLIAGFAYDARGDYGFFLIAGVVGSVLCGLLLLTLPAYPGWDREEAEAKAQIA